MRYVVMHKASRSDEAGTLPTQELVQSMGRFIGEAVEAGKFLAGEGLRPSSERVRVASRGVRTTVTRGPYAGAHELPAGFAAIKVPSQDAAIEWAKRFAQALGGDVDLEVGRIVEAWDLGLCPKPDGDGPLRFLVIHKANAATEAGTPPTAAARAAVRQLVEETTAAGALQFFESFLPSSKATRLQYRNQQRRTVDGPFSESKELVGGFCMVQMHSLDEVLAWTDRYAQIIGGNLEVDVRPVAEPPAAGRRDPRGGAGH